jgi:hypothetical protein
MYDIVNKIKDAFSRSAPKDAIPADVLFNVRTQIFQALHICLSDLVIDGHIDNSKLTDMLDGDVLDIARQDITASMFAQELMSVDSKQQAIDANCVQFYVEALVQYVGQNNDITQRLLNGDSDAIKELDAQTIDAINDVLAEVNDQFHEQFCAYMGYNPADMGYDAIHHAVTFAMDNNMMDGKSLERWFPVAIANMPDEAVNNPVATPRP